MNLKKNIKKLINELKDNQKIFESMGTGKRKDPLLWENKYQLASRLIEKYISRLENIVESE